MEKTGSQLTLYRTHTLINQSSQTLELAEFHTPWFLKVPVGTCWASLSQRPFSNDRCLNGSLRLSISQFGFGSWTFPICLMRNRKVFLSLSTWFVDLRGGGILRCFRRHGLWASCEDAVSVGGIVNHSNWSCDPMQIGPYDWTLFLHWWMRLHPVKIQFLEFFQMISNGI